jgi:hypothetical protein
MDAGPDDVGRDPDNPWAFSISMIYPTYVDTTNVSLTYNYSLEVQLNCSKLGAGSWNSTGCQKAVLETNNAFNNETINAHGYSPSNMGGVVSGRWDQLTARGIHLHYPPENWGASFEPTRALVSSKPYPHNRVCLAIHGFHAHRVLCRDLPLQDGR